MKRAIFSVLFSILLSCPTVYVIADNTFDTGRPTPFGLPFLQFPMDGDYSKPAGDKKEEGEQKSAEQKQKEIRDKKVDDAIKKAWEEK